MRWAVGVAMSVGAAAACSSENSGSGPACADISGNYSVTVERLSGTCDPSLDPKQASVGVAKAADGSWVLLLPGVEGGCPGTLNAATCRFTSACELKDRVGAVLGTASIDYTFTASGYTGSTANGLAPPAVATRCEVTYRETGRKL